MKQFLSILTIGLLIAGCAPKMGKDILIEPQGNVRLENTQAEVMMGVLSLLGISNQSGEIRLGSDLLVSNKWHSDIKVVSMQYTLSDGKEAIAQGEMNAVGSKAILIPSGAQTNIPLSFRIDTKQLNNTRFLGILQSKRKLYVRGDVLIEVWGIQKHHLFDKEVTAVIQKALSGV